VPGSGRVRAPQPRPPVVDHFTISAGLGQEPPLQPLDFAVLRPGDRLSAGQGLVAIPWKLQALQVVTEATGPGPESRTGVVALGTALMRAYWALPASVLSSQPGGYSPNEPLGHDPAYMDAEDANLLARVAGGDLGRPLEELYDRYAVRLYGLGLRLLGDPGLAEELVQETFVRLWQSAGRYDPQRGSVTSLVFTIARRLAIDLRRRPSSRPFAELEASQGAERDPGGDAIDRLLLGLHVRDALDSLPGGQREVLELLYLQDLTQRQVADRVGVPLGTVKTRAFYGLRALKEALAERDVDV
jgi:RNA polymerase sigma-70 factor (ECF subfamily)